MKEKKKVILTCSVCLSRNYSTNKNSSNAKRIELMKYCPKCNKHTLHKETKEEEKYEVVQCKCHMERDLEDSLAEEG